MKYAYAFGMAAVFVLTVGMAQAEGIDPADAQLTVTVEVSAAAPFEQELILVRVHGSYSLDITLQNLEQPTFQGFAWMQLGRDKWGEGTFDGRAVKTYDRVMAVFAARPGRLEIAPFVHHLTVLGPDGERRKHDVVSNSVALDVKPNPIAASFPPVWWLPARKVTLSEVFDRDPGQLRSGETVTRTVTLEADGVGADLLPPMPRLRTAGVLAFPGPEERSMRITPEGPVATVVWRWTVRPMIAGPVTLTGVDIPWFDTVARQPRTLVIAPVRFGTGTPGVPAEARPVRWALRHGPLLVLTAGGLGFGLALGLMLGGWRFRSRGAMRIGLPRMLPAPGISPRRPSLGWLASLAAALGLRDARGL